MICEVAASLLVFACAAAPDATAADRSGWSHVAAIDVGAAPTAGPLASGSAGARLNAGLVEFELTPEAFDLARTDLGDLRLSGPHGRDVPYVRRVTKDTLTHRTFRAKLYNRTFVPGLESGTGGAGRKLPGERSTVTADFGERLRKSRVGVATAGTDFRRSVLVEASDDGESFRVLRDGALLFRVAHSAAGKGYERSTVDLPDNDFRYLRVTVMHAPDDGERVEITGVVAWQPAGEPPETRPVPLTVKAVRQLPKKKLTEIVLDLAFRKLPLHSLALDFADSDFHRHVTISGRNAEKRVVRTPREDAAPLEREVEVPWTPVAGGVVCRFSAGGRTEEHLSMKLAGARYRYLRVRIGNRDDEPLEFLGASATRLVHYVAFQPRGSGDHALYLGDPDARAPSYDFVHYAGKLRAEGVTEAMLGPVEPNPEYGVVEEEKPWSERHKWLLWAALLAAAAVLGLLLYRQIKTIAPEDSDD